MVLAVLLEVALLLLHPASTTISVNCARDAVLLQTHAGVSRLTDSESEKPAEIKRRAADTIGSLSSSQIDLMQSASSTGPALATHAHEVIEVDMDNGVASETNLTRMLPTASAVVRKSAGTMVVPVAMPEALGELQPDDVSGETLGAWALVVAVAAGISCGSGLVVVFVLSSRALEALRAFAKSDRLEMFLLTDRQPEPPHLCSRPDLDCNLG